MEPLTDLQQRVLDIALALQRVPDNGARHTYVATHLGMGYTAYLQHLNGLLDKQAAVAYAPVLVYRMRRIRDARMAQRGHR